MSDLVAHATAAIDAAYAGTSKCSEAVLALEGMSGYKTRHLYNNMCNRDGATYLEVGTWKGSSFIAAMTGNTTTTGFCVDNWSEFGGPRVECLANFATHLSSDNTTVLDKSAWDVTAADLNGRTIDIFMYDGAHNYDDQKRAITHFAPLLSDTAVIMVDDWLCDWVDVKRGTMDGLTEAGLTVLFSKEIPFVGCTDYHCGGDTFWNGCGVFVVQKSSA